MFFVRFFKVAHTNRVYGYVRIFESAAMMLFQPYQERAIRFLELWPEANWRMKIYGIAWKGVTPGRVLIDSAKSVARATLAGIPMQRRLNEDV